MIHSGTRGEIPIYTLPGTVLEAITGEILRTEANVTFVRFDRGDTLWFRIRPERIR